MKRAMAAVLILAGSMGCASAERDQDKSLSDPPAAVLDEPVTVTKAEMPADGAEVLD